MVGEKVKLDIDCGHDRFILSSISFLLKVKRYSAYWGPNGVDKTTLLKTIGGLLACFSIFGSGYSSYG